jgi:hypothetical protein
MSPPERLALAAFTAVAITLVAVAATTDISPTTLGTIFVLAGCVAAALGAALAPRKP